MKNITRQKGGGRVVWWEEKKQLPDGYRYPDSDFTEWKLVVPNVCILNLLQPMLVLAVKVRLPRLKENQQGTLHLSSQN